MASAASTALVPAPRTGLLLLNLGTPDAPHPGPVRRYLRQFLWDRRVLDLPPVGRWLLLNLVILPFRPRRSAEAYEKIWDPQRGSPLLFHSQDLTAGVQQRLGPRTPVVLGMRYGNPSIARALRALVAAGVDRVVVLPLFPQAASSTTGSAMEEVFRQASRLWNVPPLHVVDPFFEHPAFLRAWQQVAGPVLERFQPDHVLFSYHGLPERHVRRAEGVGTQCLSRPECCATLGPHNRGCYRAQCFATTRLLANALGLAEAQHSQSFQSRLGRTAWIGPYTEAVISQLAQRGVKKLAVMCPAFVADCLETLEEIGMRAQDQFRAAGGQELVLVPSLNSHAAWVDAVAELAGASSGWI